MRIKSKEALSSLGKHAQIQITPLLDEVLDKNKRSVSKKQSKSRISKTDNNNRYCPWPSSDPAVELHKALEARYGRWSDNGSIVSEMIIPGHDVAFRYDWAHLHAKITIEFDGFFAHFRLDDFNKDRIKQRHAARNGWLPINVTNRDVKYNLAKTMEEIEEIIGSRGVYNEKVVKKGNTQHIWINAHERSK